MRTTTWLMLAASTIAACSWTQFDDLQRETWVTSSEKPDVKSSDFGVAIQRGARGGDGGTLVVLGAGQATYSELVYDPRGEVSLAATLELNTQYGIGNLDAQPILLADPTSDDVALVVSSGASSIAVLTGAGEITLHQLFLSPSTADAATYLQPPPRTDPGHVGEAQPVAPLIASADYVAGTFYTNPPNPQPRCKLTDTGNTIAPRALGAVSAGAFDDVLAWGAGGKLYRYPGSVFHCTTAQGPSASIDTGFAPGHGSQILAIDGGRVVLQGHHDADDAGFLQVFNATTLAPVGGPISLPKLRSAAILNSHGTSYVIAGYPTAIVDGKTSGEVMLFPISAAGLDAMPAATFSDAQPDDNEAFGRAVTAMPFNGTELVAIAANNEIFMYFRANLTDGTALYDETRQGR